MRALLLLTVLATALLSGCGYNTLQSQDEQVKAAWSQVLNQYQRRADLVPNLVNVVKGAAAQERQVLDDVVQARSRVGSIQATPELINDEEAFKKFQAAQAGLTSALSRLLAVAENYPELKSIEAFRDLQAQLEGVGESHRGGTQAVYRICAGLQHDGAIIPLEPHREAVRPQSEAEFLGGERRRDLEAADRGLWRARSGARADAGSARVTDQRQSSRCASTRGSLSRARFCAAPSAWLRHCVRCTRRSRFPHCRGGSLI